MFWPREKWGETKKRGKVKEGISLPLCHPLVFSGPIFRAALQAMLGPTAFKFSVTEFYLYKNYSPPPRPQKLLRSH